MVLMKGLGHKRKILTVILVNEVETFALVYIIMLIILIFLLMEKKPFNLKLKIKMLTFQLNFASELYPTDLVLLSLEKYL